MHTEHEDPYSDAALIRAARKRLLSELDPELRKAEHEANRQSIINNVYGAGAGGFGGGPSGGLMDHLGGSPAGPTGEDPFDYFVDIDRHDAPINPETGKPGGWTKKVHRYRHEKKKE